MVRDNLTVLFSRLQSAPSLPPASAGGERSLAHLSRLQPDFSSGLQTASASWRIHKSLGRTVETPIEKPG
jgi:hypothetical protein